MTLGAFRAARDAICTPASAQANLLKERFGEFDGSITEAERDDWIVAAEEYAGILAVATDAIAALNPPADLASADAATIERYRDMTARIRQVATLLRARNDAGALAADQSTNVVGIAIWEFEDSNGLAPCP